MRVLHVISGLDLRAGGVTAAVAGLAESQYRAGLSPTVLSTVAGGADTAVAKELRALGIRVELIGPVSSRRLIDHPLIAKTLNELRPTTDVVHIHGLWEIVQHQAAKFARKQCLPYVVTPHGMLATWSLRHRGCKKRLYLRFRLRKTLNRADALHFTTQGELQQAATLGLTADSFVSPLGVHLREFTALPPDGSFRAKYLPGRRERVVLFMGRIHRVKALDLLIPAFAAARVPDCVLVIAGPDDAGYLADVQRMVVDHGLQDRVIFTGMLVGIDRIAAMADADLFVLPSYQENFGVVVLEAMAAGTPVVVSDKVNSSELIAGRGVGEVVACAVEPLAGALDRWMSDNDLRRKAGAVARQWTLSEFDWDHIAPRWKEIYARYTTGTARPERTTGSRILPSGG